MHPGQRPPPNMMPPHGMQPGMMPPQQPPMGMMQPQPMPVAQLSYEQRFVHFAKNIIPSIKPDNPQYKDTVGEYIYPYVEQIAGEFAPKITGMLIDLPTLEIVAFLQDFNVFVQKINEAKSLVSQTA